MARFVFVILYGCLIASDRFSPFAGSGHAGIVLIRREMARAILSAPVTGGDKAEYYSEAMFCKSPSPALIRRKRTPGGEFRELGLANGAWGVPVQINRLCQDSSQPGASHLHLVSPEASNCPWSK